LNDEEADKLVRLCFKNGLRPTTINCEFQIVMTVDLIKTVGTFLSNRKYDAMRSTVLQDERKEDERKEKLSLV
jgi:hypothetical protein